MNTIQDETTHLLAETLYVWRSTLAKCKPATYPLPPTLKAAMASILLRPTMGYISNTLTYSRIVYGLQERKNLVRLLKGGFLRVVLVEGPAPADCPDKQGIDHRHYRIIASENNVSTGLFA